MKKNFFGMVCLGVLAVSCMGILPVRNNSFYFMNPVVAEASSKIDDALYSVLEKDAIVLQGGFTTADVIFFDAGYTEQTELVNLKPLLKGRINLTLSLANELVRVNEKISEVEFTYVNNKGEAITENVGGNEVPKTGIYKAGASDINEAKEFLKSKYGIFYIEAILDGNQLATPSLKTLNRLPNNNKITFRIVARNFDNTKILGSYEASVIVKGPSITMTDVTATLEDKYKDGLNLVDYDGEKLVIDYSQKISGGKYANYNYVYRASEMNKRPQNATAIALHNQMKITNGYYGYVGENKETLTFVSLDSDKNPIEESTIILSRTVTITSGKDPEKPVLPPVVVPEVKTTPLYRAYNPNNGEHLYTTSKVEHTYLTASGWRDEGTAWNAPTTGLPVYRLYNPNSGEHFYTLNLAEYEATAKAGWKKEGFAFYSGDSSGTPIYRLFNPSTRTAGSHHYTTNQQERDTLMSKGWKSEHIVFYAAK